MNSFIKFSLCLLVFFQLNATSFAFEHEDSDVHFLEYNPNVIQKNRFKKKPYIFYYLPLNGAIGVMSSTRKHSLMKK
jgi:hypothetical protein